jgi:hypothetical protein
MVKYFKYRDRAAITDDSASPSSSYSSDCLYSPPKHAMDYKDSLTAVAFTFAFIITGMQSCLLGGDRVELSANGAVHEIMGTPGRPVLFGTDQARAESPLFCGQRAAPALEFAP